MRFTHACIITPDVARMRDFYLKAFERAPSLDHGNYVEFRLGGAIVSLWDLAAHLKQAPGTAAAEPNRALILELEVDDADAEHERIRALAPIAKPPTTQEWGNRSFYFRDPDGNLVNFYSRARRS